MERLMINENQLKKIADKIGFEKMIFTLNSKGGWARYVLTPNNGDTIAIVSNGYSTRCTLVELYLRYRSFLFNR